MKKLLYLVVLLAPLVLLASCIKEDYTDCERCTLTFSYMGDGTWDIFPEKITRVSLYVFNSDDDLVQTKSIEQNDLKAFQGTKLNLEPGNYRIVGVGNAFDKTEVTNLSSSSSMSDVQFHHPNANNGGKVEGNDSLYLGQKMITIPSTYWYEDDVPFQSSHLKVSYTVKSYVNLTAESTTRADGFLELRVNPALTYEPSKSEHNAYFNIMRHSKDADVEFELVDKSTGKVVHTLKLADFLNEFSQIDVTKQEVLIPIIVEFKNIGVDVTIPDWMIHNVTPDYE